MVENDDEIHIHLGPEAEVVEKTNFVDTNTIISSLNKLKSNYGTLKAKIKMDSKIKKTDIKNEEQELFGLQRQMGEMNQLIEQLEAKKVFVKEKNLTILLEKERKKFHKERNKLIKFYEEQIGALKIDLDKSIFLVKELELKLRMIEPSKLELEKKLRLLDQEKKNVDAEFHKLQKEFNLMHVELEKFRVLYSSTEREIKLIAEKLEICERQKEAIEKENRQIFARMSQVEAENNFLKSENEKIINEHQFVVKDMKMDINDLHAKIADLMNQISFCRNENETLKAELKDERIQKERAIRDKLNLENLARDLEFKNKIMKKEIDDLLNRPPTIIKQNEPLPQPEKIVEKPIEIVKYIDKEETLRELENLRIKCKEVEENYKSLIREKERISFALEDRDQEAKQWKRHSENLERKLNEHSGVLEKASSLERENNDLKSKLKFISDELVRQTNLNQEKNENLASHIKILKEKNENLENILEYYKYRR